MRPGSSANSIRKCRAQNGETLPVPTSIRLPGGDLALDPVHEEVDDSGLPLRRDGDPLWELPPLFEAPAAAGGGGVLRNEYRMAAHGRLAAVVRRVRRREAVADEVRRMAADRLHPLLGDVVPVRR